MTTDIEIAQRIQVAPISDVAKTLNIPSDALDFYGSNKAKINYPFIKQAQKNHKGKLILVTAMSPTPMGEGKTTISVGLTDGLRKLGHSAMATLREPSLGPVFGMKGGATGGGYAQVVPMEEINLHFTGDIHAIGAATNLIAAMIDNHIFQGNALQIDPLTITWKRVMDMNDRQLRNLINGIGGKMNGRPREDSFEITVASEIMAILCLSEDLTDLKNRIARIVVANNQQGQPVLVSDLNAQGAVCALLKEALKPNLVQSLEGTPVFIHGGPFANIAHGCNSVIATKLALNLTDFVVTEAGFGADLGAEKFLDIKCRQANLQPNAVVIVATVRAMKYHGGVSKDQLNEENNEALTLGIKNLLRHVDNMQSVYGLPVVVALNHFPQDKASEHQSVTQICQDHGVKVILTKAWAEGGNGAKDLAQAVIELTQKENSFRYAYDLKDSIEEKIQKIVCYVYRGNSVIFDKKAKDKINQLSQQGFGELPICMAKTPYSFSNDASQRGAPTDFSITITDIKLSAGAGFIVVFTGNIMTMPGLPKTPAAENIDIDANGKISGLF